MTEYKVSWKLNYFKADAQKCYEEIGTDGISPERVLEIAKGESTELHKCFEWDDTAAAEKFRLSQARQVIQYLVVVPVKKDEDEPPQRIFQISSERNTYQPVKFFVQHADEHALLLKRAIAELNAFQQRYKNLAELESVFEAIEALK